MLRKVPKYTPSEDTGCEIQTKDIPKDKTLPPVNEPTKIEYTEGRNLCKRPKTTRKRGSEMDGEMAWFQTLLQEVETERMHLMIFLQLKQPGALFRMCVMVAQRLFTTLFGLLYLSSPRVAHKFVAYLEQEAVSTYDTCLQDFEAGKLPKWESLRASQEAIEFWQLREDATFKDVLLAIRADEALHREMHTGYESAIERKKQNKRWWRRK